MGARLPRGVIKMTILGEHYHPLLRSATLKADGTGANELTQPANVPHWHHYARAITYVLAVESVQGSPTTWSLAASFERQHPDVPNATTSSGYTLAGEAWTPLQNEQAAQLIEDGAGWYSNSHPAPAGGAEGTVADQSDRFSSSSPLVVVRTILCLGVASRVRLRPVFADGSSPTVTVSLGAIPVVR